MDMLKSPLLKSDEPAELLSICDRLTDHPRYLNEQTLKAHMVTDHYQKFAHLSPALIAQDKDPRIIIGSGI